MPLTAAKTKTAFESTAKNPIVKAKSPTVVTLTLVFDKGKEFKPKDLFLALEEKYGASKVNSLKDTVAKRNYQLRIIP